MKTFARSAAATVGGAAMLLAGFVGTAAAQDYAPTAPSSPVLPQVGNISNMPSNLSTEAGGGLSANAAAFALPTISAGAGADGATGGTGGGGSLAFTGVESTALAAGGMTLVLAGGAAVVVSRRKSS